MVLLFVRLQGSVPRILISWGSLTLPSGLFPYSAFFVERDRRMSLRRSPFPGFLSLLTGGWRPSDSWVCSAPLALRGLWSSESYVTSGRLLSPAPCFPRRFPSLFGFLPESAWVPLPLGRFRSFRFATSLRSGPWLIVSFELVSVMRFGSASELSPDCSAPCPCSVSSSLCRGSLS